MEKFLKGGLCGGSNTNIEVGYYFLIKDLAATVALYLILLFLSYNLLIAVVVGYNAYYPYATTN
jgi:hypothetical protein